MPTNKVLRNLKYIIADGDIPVVFPYQIQHKDMIKAVKGKILGAGFISANINGKIECNGESISLNIKSRGKQDSDIINFWYLKNFHDLDFC